MIKLLRKTRKLSHLLARPAYWGALRHKTAAAIEHEDAIRSNNIATLIDVGANIGQFSVLVRAFHPTARIYAFEPLTAMANRYRKIFMNDALVTLHECAAGEEAGRTLINVSASADSSSLLPITERQNTIFPGTQKIGSQEIEVVRIDDVLTNNLAGPIFIKLDVQGFELAALKGMPRLLNKADYIYIEVSFTELYEGQALASEMIAWLSAKGFELRGVYNPVFTTSGETIQADFLFSRPC